jgi:hypothetical protein
MLCYDSAGNILTPCLYIRELPAFLCTVTFNNLCRQVGQSRAGRAIRRHIGHGVENGMERGEQGLVAVVVRGFLMFEIVSLASYNRAWITLHINE